MFLETLQRSGRTGRRLASKAHGVNLLRLLRVLSRLWGQWWERNQWSGDCTSGKQDVPIGLEPKVAVAVTTEQTLPCAPEGKQGAAPDHLGGSHTKELCHTTIGSPAWVA